MPNLFAYVVMFLWPLVALRLSKKLPTEQSVVALFLIPFLLLPVKTAVDLPGLPPFDKSTIPPMVAFAIFFLRYRKDMKLLPESALAKASIFGLFLYPVFTVLTNSDALYYGPTVLQGLALNDIVSMEFNSFASFYIPFILAYNFLYTRQSHEILLKWIVIAGLLYTIPMLWEIRMSPQLHTQIYGFFPHQFAQQIRQGGFRPVVFLGHGLEVAMFMVLVAIAAVCLWKAKLPPMDKFGLVKLGYIGVVIILCKTMGALVFTILAAPILLVLGLKWRVKAVFCIAVFVFCFPILRGEQLLPVQETVDFFANINEDRASSLGDRFRNEDQLLDKANERRLFGWGGWGRARIFDPKTGEDRSVTDGLWIIVYGNSGWLGYVSIFGLLCFPIFALYRKSSKSNGREVPLVTAGLGVMLVFNLVDLLPNSSLTHVTVLMAGAILGWAKRSTPAVDEKPDRATTGSQR